MSRQHARTRRNPTRPPRAPRPRSCGKRWFKDRISAELALAAIRHHGRDRSDRMPRRAYECPDCRGWHLTSKPERPHFTRAASAGEDAARVPGPRQAEPRKPEGAGSLRTGPLMRARRIVQGLEPWVSAFAGDHLAEHGRGPTWRELEAVFGWDRWEGALVIRYLVDEGWLREEEGGPCLLPGDRVGNG
ncbi:hypothetical protein [Nocardiopsis sp. CC223A]|uniref:hypothetical protein n=1 Tax=Nocardiopsis sp. CC223A TaxID=3044051 RepID=UPI00278C5285|nr:hypothetical protein [Nocardiopsis sp. CC223A]